MNIRTHRSLLHLLLALGVFSLLFASLPGTTAAAIEARPVRLPNGQEGVVTGDDPLPVDTLEGAQDAVVQIVAFGTFLDPEEGLQMNAAGSGSGFIISPEGIAVTNNHVVTGAAFLKVYVAGEERPRSARVLGVSECADLAVIDIEGDGFPFLQWYPDRIRVGLDVYAAGFPLGDPEYTLTRGIVAKAQANGDTNWASVSRVIQHDATINPGNSGGPLVTKDGQVVAVNYAGDNGTNQYFAISRDEVLPLLKTLQGGEDVDSIGINGQAIYVSEELAGIWVASVASGTPADDVGLQPGDVILSMENLLLAQDGSMADYCSILRSHEMGDVLRLRVLRTGTSEVLTGQINGRPLDVSFVYDQLENGGGSEDAPAVQEYDAYVSVTDESGLLTVDVPAAWSEVITSTWVDKDDDPIGQAISASADLDKYYDTWDEPGFFLGVSELRLQEYETPEAYLDGYDFADSCAESKREEYTSGLYAGSYNYWGQCGDNGTTYVNIAMTPETNDYLVLLNIQLVTGADFDALDHILSSLDIRRPADVAPTTPAAEEPLDTSGLIYRYETYKDDNLSLLVPAEWTDILVEPWITDGGDNMGQIIYIAPDLADYNDSWRASGLVVYLSPELAGSSTPTDILDAVSYDACTYDERTPYEALIDGVPYAGHVDVWSDCGNTGTAVYVLAALSDLLDNMLLMEFQVTGQADQEAFDVASQSISFGGEPEPAGVTGRNDTARSAQELTPMTVADSWGLLTVDVPDTWTDTRHELWVIDDEPFGIQTWAATDIGGFDKDWRTPGMVYRVTVQEGVDTGELLDLFDLSDSCTYGDRFAYSDSVFVGQYDVWYNCGGLDTVSTVLVGVPADDPSALVLLQWQTPVARNEAIFDMITSSFNLNPDVDIVELMAALWDEREAGETPAADTSGAANVAGSAPVAVVLANTLNVRSGPGTNYSRISAVSQGDRLTIEAASANCAWLQVTTPAGEEGWVSGNSQYVRFAVACAEIPLGETPPAPVPTPAPTPRPPSNGSAGGGAASGGTSGDSRPSPTQGCYLFQNNLNAELNITFTAQDRNWNTTFKIPAKGERQECFEPGNYTYTLDAPPPWGATNGSLDVAAGDYFRFPVNPQ